jgi:hypothetical protein
MQLQIAAVVKIAGATTFSSDNFREPLSLRYGWACGHVAASAKCP